MQYDGRWKGGSLPAANPYFTLNCPLFVQPAPLALVMASHPIQSLLQQLSVGQTPAAGQPWEPPAHGDFERYAQQLVQDSNRALLQDVQQQAGQMGPSSTRWRLRQWALQRGQPGVSAGLPALPPAPPASSPPPPPGSVSTPATPAARRTKSRMPSIMMVLVVLLIVLPEDLKPLPVAGFVAAMFIPPLRNWLLQDQQS